MLADAHGDSVLLNEIFIRKIIVPDPDSCVLIDLF